MNNLLSEYYQLLLSTAFLVWGNPPSLISDCQGYCSLRSHNTVHRTQIRVHMLDGHSEMGAHVPSAKAFVLIEKSRKSDFSSSTKYLFPTHVRIVC